MQRFLLDLCRVRRVVEQAVPWVKGYFFLAPKEDNKGHENLRLG